MSASASAFGADASAKSAEYSSVQMLAMSLGVSPVEFGIHQEQMRRSFHSPQATYPGFHNKSLPFPLNLPPSYPTYPSAVASASTRHPRPGSFRHGASVMPDQILKTPTGALEDYTRAPSSLCASYTKAKGKRSLDAFMDSRQSTRVRDTDSSGSESDTSLRKMLGLPPVADPQDSALPSSSPPSSSPIHTPRENFPIQMMDLYPSSPTPRPKRQSSLRFDTSEPPYTLPPGPYSRDKPSLSLAALIGQAINASHTGALPLNDLYTYISTVYPYYNRRDQPWMSSVRHSLSVNDAFERVPDQDGTTTRRGRAKGMTRLKGGLWRIKPDHHACFEGGNFVRKGAKGAGPGKNLGGRKRLREIDEDHCDKKSKTSLSRTNSISQSNSAVSSMLSQPFFQTVSGSSRRTSSPTAPCETRSPASSIPTPSTHSPLRPSQTTLASDSSFPTHHLPPSPLMLTENLPMAPRIASPELPALPLSHALVRRKSVPKTDTPIPASLLEPGFELEMKGIQESSPDSVTAQTRDQEVNHDLFARVFARTSSAYPSSPRAGPSDPNKAARLFLPPFPLSPLPDSSSPRHITPPSSISRSAVTLSPFRTPMSHRGLHMSPSRSLAHYKSSLEPEWKSTNRSTTPPPSDQHGDSKDGIFSTPKRPAFPPSSLQVSPFRTPARPSRSHNGKGYDPYDPETLLADELASIRKAREPQESPGGFFGKEGRKLLYESPSVPGQSDWRFRDEL